jgi:NADPH:quinone reductase-like Zn-dependent oxidoreductase
VPRVYANLLDHGYGAFAVTVHVTAKDLELLSELIEAGTVRPQIDRRYPFAEIPAAIAYLEQGRARGKLVAGTA